MVTLSNVSSCKMITSGCLFRGRLWPPAGLTRKQIQGALSAFLGESSLQKVIPLHDVRLAEGVHIQHAAAVCVGSRETDTHCWKCVDIFQFILIIKHNVEIRCATLIN